MQIQLDRIEQEPFRWNQSEPAPDEVLDRPEVLGMSEVRWTGEVGLAHPGWRLQAAIEYEQTLACSRCLKPLEQKLNLDVDLYLVVNEPQPLGGEVELEPSDLSVMALDDEILETDTILMEQLELNIPMTALCQDDCAGLCPHCGADRNLKADCCSGRSIDPRWKALEDLAGN